MPKHNHIGCPGLPKQCICPNLLKYRSRCEGIPDLPKQKGGVPQFAKTEGWGAQIEEWVSRFAQIEDWGTKIEGLSAQICLNRRVGCPDLPKQKGGGAQICSNIRVLEV